MSNLEPSPEQPAPRRPPLVSLRPHRRRLLGIVAIIAAFAIGVGATALVRRGRQPTMIALTPAPIVAMRDWNPVAVKGQVAEIFGNKFIVQDESGRALVETGPAGEGAALVAPSETVTVQGRFERGFIHAEAIAHADGRTDFVGPPGPPHGPGPLAWRGAERLGFHWPAFLHRG